MSSRYEKRGVSANKSEVHAAIKNLDKGLYPLAFCKILPDIVANDAAYCNIMHADTAGTKTSLAYLWWKETGDLSVWEKVVQDAIVMNLDDMAAVGCVDNIVLSSTIGRNKNLIPAEVISSLINGTQKFINQMQTLNVTIHLAGGETADVGDIVRTADVGYTAFARMKREDLVVNNIKGGNVIVGFGSAGKCTYETEYNSGIGSNGLTSARHDVLNKYYAQNFPEVFDPNTPDEVVFTGSKKMTDIDAITGLKVGQLLTSPTRTYIPLIKQILDNCKNDISGIIHCTGGAQTKVLKFIDGIKVVKNNLFSLPAIFKLIQTESKTNFKEMYQVFNCGHRLEVYTNENAANKMIDLAKAFNIEAKIIGYCEEATQNEVIIKSEFGEFSYK